MNTGVQIRPVRLEDAPSLSVAIDAVAREELWLGSARGRDLDATRSYVAENLAAGNPYVVAVDAARDGDVIGWCDVCRMGPDSRRHCGIMGMGLLPDYRGQGLGRKLVEAVLARADAAPFDRVELSVVNDNTAGIALYERTGFQHEGVRRDAWRLGNRSRDLVMMARTHPNLGAGGVT